MPGVAYLILSQIPDVWGLAGWDIPCFWSRAAFTGTGKSPKFQFADLASGQERLRPGPGNAFLQVTTVFQSSTPIPAVVHPCSSLSDAEGDISLKLTHI